ncbi:hypothetical protein BGZ80_001455 [Entomortierella chlamydospora]|uniref:F-box domain-containing protein n=1 Tax=Entomortierella chlamydospora TaxID=101097 RepID=A0A9P6SYB3_9FUNG|nr:hypothetical protein BGZ80_001455 [Entomortierella chlamydospora]
MGILSSILKLYPGRRLAPNPLAVTTGTNTILATTNDHGNHDSNDVSGNAKEYNLVSQSELSGDIYSEECSIASLTAEMDIALSSSLVHSPGSSTSAPPRASASGIPTSEPNWSRRIPNAITCTDTAGAMLSISRSTLIRPSKRRQESDLTSDIEATVMAMEIDKDISKADTLNGVASEGRHDPKNNDALKQVYPLVQNRMFDIPEIIRSIAEFLDKPSLAASCRVSRVWATHCAPLLWKHVGDKHWLDGRFYASVRSNAHFIRTMKCEDKTDYEEVLFCQLPRLRALSFHGDKENIAVKVKILSKVCDTLTSLVLSSVSDVLSLDTAVAVRNMKRLTTLKLQNMRLQRKQLAEILSDCGDLEFLSLSRVRLTLGSAQHEDDDLEASDDTSTTTDTGNEQSTEVTRIKYLALKEISVSASYITKMIKSCPQLLELSLARNENLAITKDIIQAMADFCPNLYALDLGSCKKIDQGQFNALFTSITQLTVINLSGTRVGDDQLLLLAENCNSITRLDIQYCTSITSEGLHRFLSHCGPSLRHLEAAGVTIEPKSFDQRHWTCTNLQILFVHVGLVGSVAPSKATLLNGLATEENGNSNHSSSTPSIGNGALEVTGNERKRPQYAVSASSSTSDYQGSSHGTQDATAVSATTVSTWNTGISMEATSASPSKEAAIIHTESDGDVIMRHPLHPVQEVSKVQYLGLMGCGPKLTCSTRNMLIQGFRSVKRLHVLGLYQAFKKEDLEWLMENLPELCRIDAEKYNVSDELLKWFEVAYPHVQVCRQE